MPDTAHVTGRAVITIPPPAKGVGYRVAELARLLGRHENTVWQWCHKGRAVGGEVVRLRYSPTFGITPDALKAFVRRVDGVALKVKGGKR